MLYGDKTYDLYTDVHAIAKAVVTQSKGFGHRRLEADTLHRDVDRAAEIAKVGETYWEASQAFSKARERLQAASLLEMPTDEYEQEVKDAGAIVDRSIEAMTKIVESEEFHRDYYGNWRVLK